MYKVGCGDKLKCDELNWINNDPLKSDLVKMDQTSKIGPKIEYKQKAPWDEKIEFCMCCTNAFLDIWMDNLSIIVSEKEVLTPLPGWVVPLIIILVVLLIIGSIVAYLRSRETYIFG